MLCHDLSIGFPVVREGILSADFTLSTDALLPIFFWSDCFVMKVPFSRLRPWQIINRIPNSDLLCNKVDLARRLRTLPPDFCDFWPQTYILPEEFTVVSEKLKTETNIFIVKPANGSLGAGVRLYRPGHKLREDLDNSIAQVYIHSFLYNSHKLDLRVYVVVSRIDPLEIFVYRDGVTRFCALSAGLESRYSYLTNIAVNSTFPGERTIELLELISEFLPKLNINQDKLWHAIDRIAILTILSAYPQLIEGEKNCCPKLGFSRCFQLLGFDILLDETLTPWLLEVNYRPSLKFLKPNERRMKENLIKDIATLFGGFTWIQEAVLSRKYGWSKSQWLELLELNSWRICEIEAERDLLVEDTRFKKVWPTNVIEFKPFQSIIDSVLNPTNQA
jgi:hypothetical protein